MSYAGVSDGGQSKGGCPMERPTQPTITPDLVTVERLAKTSQSVGVISGVSGKAVARQQSHFCPIAQRLLFHTIILIINISTLIPINAQI